MEMEEKNLRRWYDKDPVLSKTMKILQTSDDDFQIKMAINLIKVIIEHNIESNQFQSIEDIMSAVNDGRIEKGSSRWYDIDNTVRTAMQMLENCSPQAQHEIAHQMAGMIVEKFNQNEEDDSEE
jgi:hypothetical protein